MGYSLIASSMEFNGSGNKKPGLVLTHRMDGAVQNYEENVTSRQIRIADGHDEHEVTLRTLVGKWPVEEIHQEMYDDMVMGIFYGNDLV